jgi:hypothetical protein
MKSLLSYAAHCPHADNESGPLGSNNALQRLTWTVAFAQILRLFYSACLRVPMTVHPGFFSTLKTYVIKIKILWKNLKKPLKEVLLDFLLKPDCADHLYQGMTLLWMLQPTRPRVARPI